MPTPSLNSGAFQATCLELYQTALYLRLSGEEMESGEKLKNQEELLKEYISGKEELKLSGIYRDNGYSGTSFNRPGWLKLMEDVKSGLIQCIIVKDLSRLGRNYIETGNYLEMIFPFMGVRFISVNDSYDSAHSSDSFQPVLASLKNLSNDAYAKDISKKIFTAKEMERYQGLFYGNLAPYGYWKDEKNFHHLVINPEAAPVVRQIFDWKLDGLPNSQIVQRLNSQGILAPMKYLYERGAVKSKRFANNIWQNATIKVLLSNRTYTGDLAQGKKRKNLSENQTKVQKIPVDEWVIVENTHEPIVSKELFFQVQEICKQERHLNTQFYKRHSDHVNPENIFFDLVYCKSTGLKMYRTRTYYENRGMRYRFTTNSKKALDGKPCPIVSIREEYLTDCVTVALKKQAELFLEPDRYLSDKKLQKKKRKDGERKKKRIELLLSTLYQDYADGLLSLEQYKAQKKKLKARMNQSELETSLEFQNSLAFSLFIADGHLTRDLALQFIKRIYVHNSSKLEVVFNFQDEWPLF